MGIADRDYMKERYRERSGAPGSLASRSGSTQIEFDDDVRLERSGPRKNVVAAAALAIVVIVYVLWAQPFGQFVDLSSLPKSGEFRVTKEYASGPTGKLSFSAADTPIALHLIDDKDHVAFIGFARANETAELIVPAGIWHAVATQGSERSLAEMPDMRSGRPLGIIEIPEGAAIVVKPAKSQDEQ